MIETDLTVSITFMLVKMLNDSIYGNVAYNSFNKELELTFIYNLDSMLCIIVEKIERSQRTASVYDNHLMCLQH